MNCLIAGSRIVLRLLFTSAVDPLFSTGPFLVAQLEFLDLSGRRLGKLPKLDMLRTFEMRESITRKSNYRVFA